jgi:hypothetical protein
VTEFRYEILPIARYIWRQAYRRPKWGNWYAEKKDREEKPGKGFLSRLSKG